jgi:uncharacterized membrane protein YdjX (TVP38/TMEM64 family)
MSESEVNSRKYYDSKTISLSRLNVVGILSIKRDISDKGNITARGFLLAGGIALSFLFVAGILGLLIYFGVQEQVLQLLNWLDTQGIWALILFTLVMALAVVLLLPGLMLTTGAGFMFGVVEGSICVVLGTTLGAALAFLLARHLFGARAKEYVMARTKLNLVSDELTPQGWKIVMLTRLVPFFPFKLSNYFFGLTSFSLRGFVGGTLVGIIPFSVYNVYLGSIASEFMTLGVHHVGRTPWVLYIAGFLATLIIVFYLNRLARRALKKYIVQEKGEDSPCRG